MAPEIFGRRPGQDAGKKLRILHLITDLGKGGAERFLVDFCTALQGRPDVEFVIGSLYENDQYGAYTATLPVETLDYEIFSFRKAQGYDAYRRLVDRFRPHIIHTHRFLAEFLSAQHLTAEAAYVCHGHDNMIQLARAGPGTFLNRGKLNNWLEKRYLIRKKYRRVRTAFIANSRHTREYYRHVLPAFMREDVHLIPYGFDYQRFAAPAPKILDPGRPLRLVNVGSFQEKKNQIFIVDIGKALREAGIAFEIHLLGDGEHRNRVREAVEARGLGDAIFLHGNVDRVEEWLWKSDLYLHTAWYEPFGLVLLEAMAAGLPCVVLDGKGNRDVMEEGKNGFFLKEQDPALFVARIRDATASRDTYRSMSEYARTFARRYDMDEAVDRFLSFYRSFHEDVQGEKARERGL